MVTWLSGNDVARINEVNLRRARLVLGWMTLSGFNSRCGTFILVCDQPPRSTQPGHPFVGRRNEYQPKGGDALRLGSSPRNRLHPPPVDEAPSRSQVDEPPTRRRLRSVPPLRPLTRRLNAFCLIASTHFWQSL